MPIIQSSRQFEGSNIENSSLFSYLKPEVRQLKFDKKNNVDGVYVLFLPAYKMDSKGNGVWFKAADIRTNFGVDKTKKNYYVADINTDPASYFERAFKARYPEQAKVIKPGEAGNNTKFSIYPAYGHLTKRVFFNVGILTALRESQPIDKVVHVLDLPAYKGADQLTTWMNTPQPDGTESPLINDHTAAVAVFIKLVSEVSSQGGWTLSPSLSHRYQVPDVYANSDNLYNLDNIFIQKSNDEIIADLRAMYPASVFDVCMDGFAGFKSTVNAGIAFSAAPATVPVTQLPIAPPPPSVSPTVPNVVTLPAPPVGTTPVAPAVSSNPLPPPPVSPITSLPSNPVSPSDEKFVVEGKSVSKADLRAYLESREKEGKKP